ncbi:MAG: hypothetical protein ACM37W_04060 [Actinomycetota bacterium]
MEALRDQVTALSRKVDALYNIIEQLSYQLSDSISEKKVSDRQGTDRSRLLLTQKTPSYQSYSSLDPVLEHKDVLLDDNYLDNSCPSMERELTPDLQIQRLTAQLTAAYNRIAALEEQLLAQRIHT